jgi:dipeptidyl aminopeptidase/acylaminoacyl peptidase
VKRALPAAAVVLSLAAQPAVAASPGSNGQIAFERRSPIGGAIALVNADGTVAQPGPVVATGPADRDPTWAPDGRRLAFMSNRDGNEEIYVLDTETGAQTRLTFNPAQDHDPTWSPDGTQIAFASDRDGNQEIYAISAAGGTERRLTADPALERQPAWSSSGVIAFASDRTGDFELYTMDSQGSFVAQLTQDPGPDIDPSWAPDGSQIAYSHNDQIYAVAASGQNRRVVAGFGHFPAWSPDGTRIAFTMGSSAIAIVPAEGGVPVVITSGTDPNWGPLPPPAGGPDLGRTFTLTPAGARVLVAPATAQAPSTAPGLQAQLRSAVELPVGTTIDASQGRVDVDAITTTPDGPGTLGHATVSGGVFTLAQGPETGGEPTFVLRDGSLPCRRARISVLPDPEYRIRVRSRGRYRSVTGYGRAAGRGTEWLTHNRCDGTTFKVYEGVVLVRDFRRRVTVRVGTGRCYLAAARRRADALRPARTCPRVRAPR